MYKYKILFLFFVFIWSWDFVIADETIFPTPTPIATPTSAPTPEVERKIATLPTKELAAESEEPEEEDSELSELISVAELANADSTSGFMKQEHTLREFLQYYALTYIGVPYVKGGSNETSGLDCSAFTQSVFSNLGIKLPRSAREQFQSKNLLEKPISSGELRPFDLLFFKKKKRGAIDHVGIYVGKGLMIHTSSKNKRVQLSKFIDSTYWHKRFFKARRPILLTH
ncbi:MAG: C40 family peptidase [Oligoflexia bacterium]|nr:C40 family peptidase [Oligoflexia bacterium]